MAQSNDTNQDFQFRVIAGELKGLKITAPNLGATRPPLSRVRKSIFDFLKPHLAEAKYLDLFCGTGSYLFEAVSRGCDEAVGVEMEPRLADSINLQADSFGVDERLTCLCRDVFEAIPKFASDGRQFDIIMIAPPQYKRLVDDTLACLREHPICHPEGIILCQYATSEKNIHFGDFALRQRRKYGNTTFAVLSPAS
jgi:16S rRNA (guanine(966)-N(2))-methyltransferase RsmD